MCICVMYIRIKAVQCCTEFKLCKGKPPFYHIIYYTKKKKKKGVLSFYHIAYSSQMVTGRCSLYLVAQDRYLQML